MPDGTAKRLLARARAAGAPIAEVRHYPSLSSTNDQAKALARDGASAWTVVIADAQTAGRGRQGHAWSSPPGGLYLSVVLRPAPPADARWGLLPLAAGLAVVEALDGWHAGAALKWPNDVMTEGRKLGGILVEAASGAAGLESVVVGIGVNVREPQPLPPGLRDHVGWLACAPGASIDPVEVGAAVLGRLGHWYDRLARGDTAGVRDAWRVRAVPWWGRTVFAQAGASTVSGIVRGLAPDGGLLLEGPDGRDVVLRSGEVREVREARQRDAPDP